MEWILLLWFWGSVKEIIYIPEFQTKASCEEAAETFKKSVYASTGNAICISRLRSGSEDR